MAQSRTCFKHEVGILTTHSIACPNFSSALALLNSFSLSQEKWAKDNNLRAVRGGREEKSEGHYTFFLCAKWRRGGAKNNRSRLATKKPYIIFKKVLPFWRWLVDLTLSIRKECLVCKVCWKFFRNFSTEGQSMRKGSRVCIFRLGTSFGETWTSEYNFIVWHMFVTCLHGISTRLTF